MKMIKRLFFVLIVSFQFSLLHASIVILNGLTHNYKVENGQVYKGKIAIENTDNKPQNVKIFLQDLRYDANGSITYSPPNTFSQTNAGWIKLNTNLLTLKAREKTEVYYEIVVPKQISGEGSYWSVVMVEPVEDIRPDDNKEGVNITSIIRYAIQIITDYNSERAKPELKFEDVKIEQENGNRTVKIAIANQGNLYCKPSATIEIYHRKDGKKIGTFSSPAMGLLPQTSKSFHIDISKIPPDAYNAVIIATDEEENAFAINVELDVKK